jgi:RNA polymerase sigma factor (sigma-70 family)
LNWNENDIIEGCRKDNRLAQKRLYEHYFGKMMGVCMRYASHKEQATEMLNIGFYKVFKSIGKFSNQGISIEAWIYRIMVNCCLDFLRSEIKHRHDDIEFIKSEPFSEDAITHLSFQELTFLINKLPPAYRAVFNLYALDGYNHKEVGELLGISEGTSKSNFAKARAKLQKMIMEQNTVKV